MLHQLYRRIEELSAIKVAAAGSGGAGLTLATAALDPEVVSPWMQVASLAIGILVGLGSLVLVALKIVQQHRAMRSGEDSGL